MQDINNGVAPEALLTTDVAIQAHRFQSRFCGVEDTAGLGWSEHGVWAQACERCQECHRQEAGESRPTPAEYEYHYHNMQFQGTIRETQLAILTAVLLHAWHWPYYRVVPLGLRVMTRRFHRTVDKMRAL